MIYKKWYQGNFIIIAIISILICYLFTLIFINHNSNVNLRENHILQLKQDVEKIAAAVKYFFDERIDNLKDMTSLREISVFFENKALGMSMEYGLNLSLLPIVEKFNYIIKNKKIGKDYIYSRIVLIESDGTLLADSNLSNKSENYDWKNFLNQDYHDANIIASYELKGMMVSIAYYFKNKYSGQIIAWINPGNIYKYLFKNMSIDNFTYIISNKKEAYLPQALFYLSEISHIPDINNIKENEIYEFKAKVFGCLKKMIIIHLPVLNTPFFLIKIINANDIFGRFPIWLLDLSLFVLAVIIIGSSIIFIVINIKSLMLQTRLSESLKRENEIVQKNKELEIAKNAAEAADKAKSDFLANMSHEIRTPLNAVIGFADVLNSMISDKKQKSYVSSIKTSGKNLLTLINDILDLSKIEAGKMDIHYESVSVYLIVEEIKQVFSLKISEKNLEFIIDIEPQIPAGLRLDEVRLRQILLNIIGNALKFTDKGYIKLSIKKRAIENTLSHIDLIISVEDTGIGISEESQKIIFEAFR